MYAMWYQRRYDKDHVMSRTYINECVLHIGTRNHLLSERFQLGRFFVTTYLFLTY